MDSQPLEMQYLGKPLPWIRFIRSTFFLSDFFHLKWAKWS